MKVCCIKILGAVLGLLLLFTTGVVLRRVVLGAQFERYGESLPFNMESALEFRYVRMLFESGRIPERDMQVQIPDGIVVRQTYTLGAEYVYAALARCMPARWPLDARVRWASVFWFCLGIPLMSFWLWAWRGSWWAAGIGGAYYAVALAAVMRSTGQELQHENFALPFLIAHFALGAFAAGRKGTGSFLFWCALAGLMLALALCFWDLIQFYVLIWALVGVWRWVRGVYFQSARPRLRWYLTLLALVGAGVCNPYLRAHGFVRSPAMLLAYAVALGLICESLFCAHLSRPPNALAVAGGVFNWRRLLCLCLPVLGLMALAAFLVEAVCGYAYQEAYAHFLELLWAKLRWLNHKPENPALLTFAQRMLWTPPLQSANLWLTIFLFPVTLPLFLLASLIFLAHARRNVDPEISLLFCFTFISFVAFIFFMRFHVFLIIGICALLGWLGWWASAQRSFARWVVLVILLAGIGAEAAHVLDRPWRWGSVHAYLPQKQELTRWLRANTPGEPVLANFGLSAFVLCYAGSPIVLHPKFEQAEIRQRVQAYGEALLLGDERGFRDWMEPFETSYYVYSMGELAEAPGGMQMRYMVNALHPAADAAARVFEQDPGRSRYFRLLWGNDKYRVFRVITRADQANAGRLRQQARTELARGCWRAAQTFATQALLYDPMDEDAPQIIMQAHECGVDAARGASSDRRH